MSPQSSVQHSTTSVDPKSMDRIDEIVSYIRSRTNAQPLLGVVCGSGLGGLATCLENPLAIPYADIPRFPQSTVDGHVGELVFGTLHGTSVVCMRGRFHFYEGYSMTDTTIPIRVMRLLGIQYLIVTNAAGGLNPDFHVGDLMILNDHLNLPGLSGHNPLVGPNDSRFGERFTPLGGCYTDHLQEIAQTSAENLGLTSRMRPKGVYCFVSGPTYETPAECRLLRLVGGDAVGMSTVPEVVVAAHCGIQVLGLSLITNKVVFPDEDAPGASHEEVLTTVKAAQKEVQALVADIIRSIGALESTPVDKHVKVQVNGERTPALIEK